LSSPSPHPITWPKLNGFPPPTLAHSSKPTQLKVSKTNKFSKAVRTLENKAKLSHEQKMSY